MSILLLLSVVLILIFSHLFPPFSPFYSFAFHTRHSHRGPLLSPFYCPLIPSIAAIFAHSLNPLLLRGGDKAA